MKSLEELKQYYFEKLLPDLEILETERIKVCQKIIPWSAVIILVAAAVSFYLKNPVFVFFGIIGCLGLINALSRKYVRDFKADIIEKIIKSIDENLVYSPEQYIPETTFKFCRIFQHRIDRYYGDDHVQGILGKTRLEFSEVHAKYITPDSRGNTQENPIFDGLFLAADFNKKFKGTTVVLPDIAEKMFGALGQVFQSWNKSRGQLIKLEDPEFEKMFVVYGEDQIEARYILSTSLMKRIVEFKNKTKRQMYLSFCGDKIFVAISYPGKLFAPRLFRTILSFAPIEQYYEHLRVATDIVEELNLNTRIWGGGTANREQKSEVRKTSSQYRCNDKLAICSITNF